MDTENSIFNDGELLWRLDYGGGDGLVSVQCKGPDERSWEEVRVFATFVEMAQKTKAGLWLLERGVGSWRTHDEMFFVASTPPRDDRGRFVERRIYADR